MKCNLLSKGMGALLVFQSSMMTCLIRHSEHPLYSSNIHDLLACNQHIKRCLIFISIDKDKAVAFEAETRLSVSLYSRNSTVSLKHMSHDKCDSFSIFSDGMLL